MSSLVAKKGSPGTGVPVFHSCFETCDQNTANITESTCIACTLERQGHGKAFEHPVYQMIGRDIANNEYSGESPDFKNDIVKQIFEKCTNDKTKLSHTANHDFAFSHVGFDPPSPKYRGDGISIKMIKDGCSVCMGDAVRIFENFETSWSILVAFYVDKTKEGIKCKCIKKVFLLNLGPENLELFFGTCRRDGLISLKNHISEFKVETSKEDDTVQKNSLQILRDEVKPMKENLEKKYIKPKTVEAGCKAGYLSLAPKISSSNQRLQCAINSTNFKKLLNELRGLGQVVEIHRDEYPDLFAPIVPPGTIGGKKQKTKNRRKSRRMKKTLKVSNRTENL